MGRCKICSTAHAACGASPSAAPADLQVTREERSNMPLKMYRTTVYSGRTEVETIVKLTEEEAEKRGLEEYVKPKPRRGGRAPSTKSRTASNKQKQPAATKTDEPRKQPDKPVVDQPGSAPQEGADAVSGRSHEASEDNPSAGAGDDAESAATVDPDGSDE